MPPPPPGAAPVPVQLPGVPAACRVGGEDVHRPERAAVLWHLSGHDVGTPARHIQAGLVVINTSRVSGTKRNVNMLAMALAHGQ